jgi:hypothetical protein
MSRSPSHPDLLAGHAVVRLKTGESFVGEMVYDGRAVSGSMSLRVIVNGVVEYRPPKQRTVPTHVIREVVWDDDAVQRE